MPRDKALLYPEYKKIILITTFYKIQVLILAFCRR